MILRFPDNFPWKYCESDMDKILKLIQKNMNHLESLIGIVEKIVIRLEDNKGQDGKV